MFQEKSKNQPMPKKKGREPKATGNPRTAVLQVRIKPKLLTQLQAYVLKSKKNDCAPWTQADCVEYALRDLFAKYPQS